MRLAAISAALGAAVVLGDLRVGDARGLVSPEVAGVVWQDGRQGDADAPLLFGSSGQLYELGEESATPGEELSFRRLGLGGVATRVGGVVRAAPDVYFAIGEQTPLYRREDGVWHAHELPHRGPTTLAVGGEAPALGIGRHIYLLEDGEWSRAGRAPGQIEALWVGADERLYLVTDENELHRGRDDEFTRIGHALAGDLTGDDDDDDPVIGLVGRAGQELFAILRSGEILSVGGGRARSITMPEGFEDARIDALGYLADGRAAIVAVASAEDGSPESPDTPDAGDQPALIALAGESAQIEAVLPEVSAGDRAVAIASAKDATFIATRGGALALRGADDWRGGSVESWDPGQDDSPRKGAAPARSP